MCKGGAVSPREPSLHRCVSGKRYGFGSVPVSPPRGFCPCSALRAWAHSQSAGARWCSGGPAVGKSRHPGCGCAGFWCRKPSEPTERRSGGGPKSPGLEKSPEARIGAASWPLCRSQRPSKIHSPWAYAEHTSPAGSGRGSWRVCSDAGWSRTPGPVPRSGSQRSWRGGCVRRLPWRHGPLPLPGREAGGPETDHRDEQGPEERRPQRERSGTGRCRRPGVSHTGSRAPGQRGLMHPERGWERAPKNSWEKRRGFTDA